ncbi:hypothetical protein ACP70R_012358 [Stipagrostis hirtigluma subsp. patula]
MSPDVDGGTQAASEEASAAPARGKQRKLKYKGQKKSWTRDPAKWSVQEDEGLILQEKTHKQLERLLVSDPSVVCKKVLLIGKGVDTMNPQQNDPGRSNSPISHDGGRSEEATETSVVVATGTSPAEKTPKIQSPPTSVDVCSISQDNGELVKIVHVIDHKQEQGPGEIEGLDWDQAKLNEEIRRCTGQLNQLKCGLPPDDDESFWSQHDDEQREKLNEQLALYRIKYHMILQEEQLDDAELIQNYPPHILEEEGYFVDYEEEFEWYFEPEYCNYVGFQDYQRLVLRDNAEYLHWGDYHEIKSTFQNDREFVEFYERLSSKTKWIVKFLGVSDSERQRIQRVAYYQAVKIAAEYHNIITRLVYRGFDEYKWSVSYDFSWYNKIANLYFEIWKRVARQKVDFITALKEMYAQDICPKCRFDIKLELDYIPRSGGMKFNYDNYIADIDETVQDSEAYSLIMEAVKIFVPKLKTYYDYAKKKLDIAEKIGVIPPKAAC